MLKLVFCSAQLLQKVVKDHLSVKFTWSEVNQKGLWLFFFFLKALWLLSGHSQWLLLGMQGECTVWSGTLVSFTMFYHLSLSCDFFQVI